MSFNLSVKTSRAQIELLFKIHEEVPEMSILKEFNPQYGPSVNYVTPKLGFLNTSMLHLAAQITSHFSYPPP